MKIIKQTKFGHIMLWLICFLWASLASANGNKLNNISINNAAAGKVEVHLSFSNPVSTPKVFSTEKPPRLIFDFPGVDVAPAARKNATQRGVIKSIRAAANQGRTRLVVDLNSLVDYTVESAGADVLLMFESNNAGAAGKTAMASKQAPPATKEGLRPEETYDWYGSSSPSQATRPKGQSQAQAQAVSPKKQPAARNQAPTHQPARSTSRVVQTARSATSTVHPAAAAQNRNQSVNALRGVDFRRNEDGGGRVIIVLPNANAKVTPNKRANILNISLHDVDVPANWRRRLDALDFATPVSKINISQRGINGRVSVVAREDFEYEAERKNNIYTVNISKVEKKEKTKLGEKEKKVFTGDKLSLNFQDIEVRAVLQLLADFTNKNIVVSDSVDGNITVRLKDVPWDQALDIVLESKNLGMRENGNVIWVAPNEELEAKEAHELEMLKKKIELEPLVTEYIPINFAKAANLVTLIEKRSTVDDEGSHSLLSDRGSVSHDERTNTLIIQDTTERVEEVRDLLAVLDVPVQQVLIESRIVTATDEFSRGLGARFGVTPHWNNSGSAGIGGGSLGGADGYYDSAASANQGNGGALELPGLNDRLSVNLPTPGAAGTLGLSVLTKNFLLDLELSALQAESKGEIIATPRVITSNQTKAVIEQGVEIPYQQAAGDGATSVAFKKAVLSLEVTPQITPDEHVSMDLKVSQDTVGSMFANVPSISTRQLQTRVLVENGQTIVLGGVHEETRIDDNTKVPVLGDLPIVGRAFRQTNKKEDKRELLIFVTPKIVDAKSSP